MWNASLSLFDDEMHNGMLWGERPNESGLLPMVFLSLWVEMPIYSGRYLQIDNTNLSSVQTSRDQALSYPIGWFLDSPGVWPFYQGSRDVHHNFCDVLPAIMYCKALSSSQQNSFSFVNFYTCAGEDAGIVSSTKCSCLRGQFPPRLLPNFPDYAIRQVVRLFILVKRQCWL